MYILLTSPFSHRKINSYQPPNNFYSYQLNVSRFNSFHKSLSSNHLSTVSISTITAKSWTNPTASGLGRLPTFNSHSPVKHSQVFLKGIQKSYLRMQHPNASMLFRQPGFPNDESRHSLTTICIRKFLLSAPRRRKVQDQEIVQSFIINTKISWALCRYSNAVNKK